MCNEDAMLMICWSVPYFDFLWRLRDVSKISLASIAVFQKYSTKMVSCDFRRVITISDKIDVGQLQTPKKWNVFCQHCIDINQVCHGHEWADKKYVRILWSSWFVIFLRWRSQIVIRKIILTTSLPVYSDYVFKYCSA